MTYKRTAIIVGIMLAAMIITSYAGHSEKVLPNKSFDQFPVTIDQWRGKTGQMDDEVYNILGVEDYILADYRKNDTELVNLYVGFYQSQKEGDIIHSPKNCMPGSGWNIIQTSIETVPVNTEEKEINVIKLLLQKGAEKQVVLYWFQSRGRIISSEYMQKIWLVVDSIIKQRTDGSFVRLISPVVEDEKSTTLLLKEFAKKVYPFLKEHIPS